MEEKLVADGIRLECKLFSAIICSYSNWQPEQSVQMSTIVIVHQPTLLCLYVKLPNFAFVEVVRLYILYDVLVFSFLFISFIMVIKCYLNDLN